MSDLLKEAIADAKAVRATALANAKAALEESFKPTLEAMLAEKLKSEIGMEDEAVHSSDIGSGKSVAPLGTQSTNQDPGANQMFEESDWPIMCSWWKWWRWPEMNRDLLCCKRGIFVPLFLLIYFSIKHQLQR